MKKIAICITWRTPIMPASAFWYVHPECFEIPTSFSKSTEWSTRNVMEWESTTSLLEVECICGNQIGESPKCEQIVM